jgi:2-oxoisovalerate dehydrogenase E1 component
MNITKDDWIQIAKTLVISRLIDTIEEEELAPSGKVLYQFSSKGHELGQIILAHFLNNPHDGATVYYRSRPFVLASGMTIEEAFSGPISNSTSLNGGRDIGVVHFLPKRKGPTIMPASGDVGAQYTPAVGWAQAAVYRSTVLQETDWNESIGIALGGDASCATNGFWSALTIATTQNFPMIFFIEDNNYGISVTGDYQTPGSNIAHNLAAFSNLLILEGDGTDPEETAALIHDAIQHARKRISPVLIRLDVPRICGHSGKDTQTYKSDKQKKKDQERDPLHSIKKFLIKKKMLKEKEWEALYAACEAEVRSGLEKALSAPNPTPEGIINHVFHDGIDQQIGGLAPEHISLLPLAEVSEPKRMNFIEGIRKTLEIELQVNPRVMIFGEDVGVKGGVHGATIDLQLKHGKERVFDTSLSEEGIIGRSLGLAYAGLMPVPEIQFRKYLDPAMEQFNDAGTVRWRTNNTFACPFVVRIPVGHSKVVGDPWHSVSGEAIFAHTIGWRIAFPSTIQDAVGLLRSALRGNDPTVFLEHRNLLDTYPGRGNYPGDQHIVPFGVANVLSEGTDATIVTWGEMVHRILEVQKELSDYSLEIIDLRTISPWDRESVLKSVKKTGHCLIAHEDAITGGFGAEIAATITEDAFTYLDAPVMRLATADIPIPYNKQLMDAVIPTTQLIKERLEQLLRF